MHVYENILGSEDCLSVSQGYIHVYDHNIQTSSPLKLLGQSKPTLCGAFLGSVNESLYKWPRSYDQDGRCGYK